MLPRGLGRNELPGTLLGTPGVAWTLCIDGAVRRQCMLSISATGSGRKTHAMSFLAIPAD